MKKLLSAIAVCALGLSVNASELQSDSKVQLENSDGSYASSLCIQAVEKNAAFKRDLARKGSRSLAKKLECNGEKVGEFVDKYEKRVHKVARVKQDYVFTNKSGSFETGLCIAAAKSNYAYKRAVLQAPLSKKRKLDRVTCNDMPIAKFAKKYGNEAFGS